MRKCKTCGINMLFAYFLFGLPFTKRKKRLSEAKDCIDLMTIRMHRKIQKEIEKEWLDLPQPRVR